MLDLNGDMGQRTEPREALPVERGAAAAGGGRDRDDGAEVARTQPPDVQVGQRSPSPSIASRTLSVIWLSGFMSSRMAPVSRTSPYAQTR